MEAEVAAIAERLGAGVATLLLGLPVVDQREPWVTGAIGLLGTRPSWHLMQECDRLLIVGSNMPYGEFYPPEGIPAVQVDVDGAQLGCATRPWSTSSATRRPRCGPCSTCWTTATRRPRGAPTSRGGRHRGARGSAALPASRPTRSTRSWW